MKYFVSMYYIINKVYVHYLYSYINLITYVMVPIRCRWFESLTITQDTQVPVSLWWLLTLFTSYCFVIFVHFRHRQSHTLYPKQEVKTIPKCIYGITRRHNYVSSSSSSLETPNSYCALIDTFLLLTPLILVSQSLVRAIWLSWKKT